MRANYNSLPSFRKAHILTALSIVLASVGSSAMAADALDVHTLNLTNGMKILVHEDHALPIATTHIFYQIGSRNERPGITGLSHFFEHMMFNGAKKYGPKQLDTVMEAAGGANNAYTTENDTVYTDWFPAHALELIFDIESDRIASLAFDPKMIESERGVVASERRLSVEGDNGALLEEQVAAIAFTAHPYQWPVIGWMVDIENWTMPDLKHYFEIGYSPSNATMIVCGDVKFDEVAKLARTYLEPIPGRPKPLPVTTREPEQSGERRVKLVKPAELPQLLVAYHVPESAHPDYFPLQLLRNILTGGNSSRLYQRLVDKDQIALDVSADMSLALDPTLFFISAQAKAGVDPALIEKTLYAEIDRIKSGGVTDFELQKAKNGQLARFYRELTTINGQAGGLGNHELFFGGYQELFNDPEKFNRVTAADIQRVVRKYFDEKNRNVGTLVPEKEKTGGATEGHAQPGE